MLKPESWKQVFTPVVLKSGKAFPYGFGWNLDEEAGQKIHHGGAWQGFKSHICRWLGRDLTIVLCEPRGGEPGRVVDLVAEVLEPALAKPIAP